MKAGSRVNRFACNANFEMEVRAGRLAGRADRADGLAAADALAVGDIDCGEVPVPGRVAATVVDEDVVAVTAVPLRHDHRAGGGGADGGAGGGGNGEALMGPRRAAGGVRAPPERGSKRARGPAIKTGGGGPSRRRRRYPQ